MKLNDINIAQWKFAKERPATTVIKYLMFILWPFGSWLYSLKSANTKSSIVIFFLFSCLVCWHFSPTGYNDRYDDFLGMCNAFQHSHYSTSQMLKNVWYYITFSPRAPKELYQVVTSWFVKLFTDNYHFYFLTCGILYAIVQLGVVKRIVLDKKYKNYLLSFVILALIVFQRDIFTVQNPRFGTGFWICVLFTIKYYTEGHKWYNVIPILLTPLIHSAMWVYVIFFMCGLFASRNIKVLQVIALCSIPFAFFDANLLTNFDVTILPKSLQRWVTNYTSDEFYKVYVLDVGRSGFWWITAMFEFLTKAMFIYITWLLIKNRKHVMANPEGKQLYGYYIFLFAAVNMIQFVPVLGTRYTWFMRLFCLYVWYKGLYGRGNSKWIVYGLAAVYWWECFRRYGYILGGALSVTTPIDLFFMPLPYLMGKGLIW